MNAVAWSCTPRRARSAMRRWRVEAEHRDRPGRGHAQTLEDLDERGLAGAVGPEQADHLAGGGDGQIDAAKRVDGSVRLAEGVNVDGDHGEAMVAGRRRRRQ